MTGPPTCLAASRHFSRVTSSDDPWYSGRSTETKILSRRCYWSYTNSCLGQAYNESLSNYFIPSEKTSFTGDSKLYWKNLYTTNDFIMSHEEELLLTPTFDLLSLLWSFWCSKLLAPIVKAPKLENHKNHVRKTRQLTLPKQQPSNHSFSKAKMIKSLLKKDFASRLPPIVI